MANLQQMLRSLVKIQEESGAKTAARDTRVVAELAADDALVERLERLSLVDYFEGELNSAKDHKAQFDEILKSMARPGMLTKGEASEVASRFVGGRSRYASKAAALEAIRDRRSRDAGLKSKVDVS
jgi:hypothetical protein